MLEKLDDWLENPFISTAAYFSVTVLLLGVFLAIFELVTRYKDWQEVKRGNVAVAMAIGGKIFGICNIFHYIIPKFESLYDAIIWAFYGYVLLLVAYYIFEFLTPVFKVDEELSKDNRAVGLLSMFISISLSYVIGASIS
jgi:putative membrane protein